MTQPEPTALEGTELLTGDASWQFLAIEEIDRLFAAEVAASPGLREKRWRAELRGSDREAFRAAQRQRLAGMLGLIDDRLRDAPLWRAPAVKAGGISAEHIRWEAFDGVFVEGLLLTPVGAVSLPTVVAIPEAGVSPEALCGMGSGEEDAVGLRLARAGFVVLAPHLAPRDDQRADQPAPGPHRADDREWLHQLGFQVGRHLIGLEVAKLLSCLDRLSGLPEVDAKRLALFGVGQGSLTALHAAALDERARATVVLGGWGGRERVPDQPPDRTVWNYLTEFGDAELAALILPRRLAVAAESGTADAGGEFDRACSYAAVLDAAGAIERMGPGGPADAEPDAASHAVSYFTRALDYPGLKASASESSTSLATAAPQQPAEVRGRTRRQFAEMQAFLYRRIGETAGHRAKWWAGLDGSSLDQYVDTLRPYRTALEASWAS